MLENLYGKHAAALYAQAADFNKTARFYYMKAEDAYYLANAQASYDDWRRARRQWDYFYRYLISNFYVCLKSYYLTIFFSAESKGPQVLQGLQEAASTTAHTQDIVKPGQKCQHLDTAVFASKQGFRVLQVVYLLTELCIHKVSRSVSGAVYGLFLLLVGCSALCY
jgi:hypothetical protein